MIPEPIREESGPDGIVTWWFDCPGEKVNTLGRRVLERLESLIGGVAGRPGVRGILVVSAKRGNFVAGADLEEMRALLAGADAAARSREASALGHRVFASLAALPFPTVAVINGTCMGGGTELALACRYRVAADDPQLRIALPEVKLGILPAWGGCTRLPRLVGLVHALGMVLPGKELRASQARKMGLVDDLVPPEEAVASARRFLDRILREGDAKVLARRRRGPWLLEGNPLGRALVFSKAAAGVAKETGGHYPAPGKALEVIRAGLAGGPAAGFAAEEEALGALVATPVAKHLVGIFFMTQENKRYTGGVSAAPRDVKTMGVLGAGLMGAGIAQVAAGKGLPVRLKDVSFPAVAKGMSRIAGELRARVRKRALTRREAERRMGRIAPATGWEGFGAVDLVVEAVLEKLEVKRQVLSEFQAVNAKGIFASNTSTLPIGLIAQGARDPSRVVGLHFFNPVPKMPLVEVIPASGTDPEVTATAAALAKRLGKFVVVVKDRPGFLVNRILTPYLVEAVLCVEEGIPMASVDRALVRFGMPMGPVALIQHVGTGVAQHAGRVMLEAFSDRLVPSKLMEAVSPEKPFYLGNGYGRTPNPAVLALVGKAPVPLPEAEIQERLVMAMVNEAAWALGEGVVATAQEVDLAMIFGTGFAPFRGGLLRHADALGVSVCADAVKRLHERHGRRFTPAPLLLELGRSGKGFYP